MVVLINAAGWETDKQTVRQTNKHSVYYTFDAERHTVKTQHSTFEGKSPAASHASSENFLLSDFCMTVVSVVYCQVNDQELF